MRVEGKIILANMLTKRDNDYMNNTKNKVTVSSTYMISDHIKDIKKVQSQVKIKQVSFAIQGAESLIEQALKASK